MITLASQLRPSACCLVPEKRQELTTEGGLQVAGAVDRIKPACAQLTQAGIEVSLFIDPKVEQIKAAHACAVPVIELHTGAYAEATGVRQDELLAELKEAAHFAASLGLQVNAGHGLHCGNVQHIARLPDVVELNIGHSLVAEALFKGFRQAVSEMRVLISAVDS